MVYFTCPGSYILPPDDHGQLPARPRKKRRTTQKGSESLTPDSESKFGNQRSDSVEAGLTRDDKTAVQSTRTDLTDNDKVVLWHHEIEIDVHALRQPLSIPQGLVSEDFVVQHFPGKQDLFALSLSQITLAIPLLHIQLKKSEAHALRQVLICSSMLTKAASSFIARLRAVYQELQITHELHNRGQTIILTLRAVTQSLTVWSEASVRLAHDKTFRSLLDWQYPEEHHAPATVPFFYSILQSPPSIDDWSSILSTEYAEALKTEPMHFQKNAIAWMVNRELGLGQFPNLWIAHGNAKRRITYLQKELGLITPSEDVVTASKVPIRGGLLSDEMGLGKSLEVIATIISNPRKDYSSENKLDHFTQNTVRPIRSTLIVSPSTILHQWLGEVEKHSTLKVLYYVGIKSSVYDESIDFDTFDIVVTSYAILSAEIYHAAPVRSDRTLRRPPAYEKKRSPLTQVEWWRVVMDEAQMIQTGISAAAQVACHLPRVLAWIVTGTPISNTCLDLYGLLHFLRMDPIYTNSKLWHQMLSSDSAAEYIAGIFEPIACRNTKALVADEMSLPPQTKYLCEVNFTALEKEAFRDLMRAACSDLGLGQEGSPLKGSWQDIELSRLQGWITQLRQTCSHPQAGQLNRGIFSGISKPVLSLDEVLQTMLYNTSRDLEINRRAHLSSILEEGRILEYKKDKDGAQNVWNSALPKLQEAVARCERDIVAYKSALIVNTAETSSVDGAANEQSLQTSILDLRYWREVLHRCYFFLGTIYFQLENPDLEKEYYAKAKDIRKKLLSETEQFALKTMSVLKKLAKDQAFVVIPEIKFPSFSGGIQTRALFERLQQLTELLNNQANQLDEFRELCIQRLTADLADQNDDPSGEEYQGSAVLQEEAFAYHDLIRIMVADRVQMVLGLSNALAMHDAERAMKQDDHESKSEAMTILKDGLKLRASLLPQDSLGSLAILRADFRSRIRTLENSRSQGQSSTMDWDIARKALKELDASYTKQRESVEALQKEVEQLNDIYNARLEYYRQFQAISDSVQEYTVLRKEKAVNIFDSALERARGLTKQIELSEDDISEDVRSERVESALRTVKLEQTKVAKSIEQGRTRTRYLEYLSTDAASRDESCMICTSAIEIGAFTICGHMYCKDCFYEWFRNHRACPICKTILESKASFQTITLQPPAKEANLEFKLQLQNDISTTNLHEHYKALEGTQKKSIAAVQLRTSYSSKVNAIVQHIMSLPTGSKSVVYSNFLSVVEVIRSALAHNNLQYQHISELSTYRQSQVKRIESFRDDPDCAVLLLWGKAQSAGLTLVNATNLFLVEPLLSPAVEQQVISRIHRIGQTKPTNIFQYVVTGTLEMTLLAQSSLRRSNADQHTRDSEMQQEGQLLQTSASAKSEQPDLDQAILLLKSNLGVLGGSEELLGVRETLVGTL